MPWLQAQYDCMNRQGKGCALSIVIALSTIALSCTEMQKWKVFYYFSLSPLKAKKSNEKNCNTIVVRAITISGAIQRSNEPMCNTD